MIQAFWMIGGTISQKEHILGELENVMHPTENETESESGTENEATRPYK